MKKIFITVAISLFVLASCEEWLDVKPKSQVEGSVLFKTESGFKDALTGIYTAMTAANMYGREMTYGFVDCIGDAYYNVGSNNIYAFAKAHDYANATAEAMIASIWSKSYNTIATINNLLENLEEADPAMFSEDNYNVIKGEALGLRAFLHFDLLRLFGPSWVVGRQESAIPYVTAFGYTTTPVSSVEEVTGKILEDLQAAANLLQASDPLCTGRVITTADDNGYLSRRHFHFNYYAAKATMARVYLYKGDLPNASARALEVIESGRFPWTSVDAIATTQDSARNRTFTPEQVFALQVDNMTDYVYGRVYGDIRYTALLNLYSSWLNTIWPTATHASDWRRVYFVSNSGTNNASYYVSSKLWQEGMGASYIKRMPLIRLPEMYLILAEADPDNAAAHLNTIRDHRGVAARVTATTEAELQTEICLEYYREYVSEGYLFYYYKRLNRLTHRGGFSFADNVAFNPELYVLPVPKDEIEFGNRNQ